MEKHNRPYKKRRKLTIKLKDESKGGKYNNSDKNSSQKTPVKEAPRYNLEKLKAIGKAKNKRFSPTKDEMRLNRYIANSGVCSRREADELIAKGSIAVNGKVITEMGYKVQRSDTVTYNGKPLKPEKKVYVLLNKPKGFITTMKDPQGRKTVMQLVQNASQERIYPVGRLDRNTTGLLLFTNDGDLSKQLAHPSGNVQKIYHVTLDKPLSRTDFENLTQNGVELEDGPVPIDGLSILSDDMTMLGIELHSGKNRIVRRIFEHFGYEVVRLDRTVFAGLSKIDLPRGKWRFLTEKEVIQLKYFTGKNQKAPKK